MPINPQVASAAISTGGGVLGSLVNLRTLKKQVKANQQANAMNYALGLKNIEMEKATNEQNKYLTTHAAEISRASLKRAGYSVADPQQSGYSPATMVAPHNDATMIPDVNPSAIGFGNVLTSGASDFAKSISEIMLQKANARASNANARGSEIDNDYKAAMNQATVDSIKQQIEASKASQHLNEKQVEKLNSDIDLLSTQIESAKTSLSMQKFDSKMQLPRYQREVQEQLARIANIRSDTDIKKIDKEMKRVELSFIRLGLSPSDTSVFGTIARIAAAPGGKELLPKLTGMVVNTFSQIFHIPDSGEPDDSQGLAWKALKRLFKVFASE